MQRTSSGKTECDDYWVKVVEMLQTNWALIVPFEGQAVDVHIVAENSGIFDAIRFESRESAEAALARNEFRPFKEDTRAQSFLSPPRPPFRQWTHPNGPIYSSGRFWR